MTLDMRGPRTPHSRVDSPQFSGQGSTSASELHRWNWIVDLQCLPEVQPRCALWVGHSGGSDDSGKAAVRSTGPAWPA